MLTCFSLFAAPKAGKVLYIRGKIVAKRGQTQRILKKNDSIYQGERLQSAGKSFGKFLLKGGEQLTLAPKSQLIITAASVKKRAGIVHLVSGKVRAKVVKNFVQKKKNSFYVKTKSAAMGVRGTDFLVTYNKKSENTSLVTFSGQVVMNTLEKGALHQLSTPKQIVSGLQKVLKGEGSVVISKGEFSNALEGKTKAPVKIDKRQFYALRKNRDFVEKRENNVLPPGVSEKKFLTGEKELRKKAINEVGRKTFERNEKREKFKERKSGSFIHLESGRDIKLSERQKEQIRIDHSGAVRKRGEREDVASGDAFKELEKPPEENPEWDLDGGEFDEKTEEPPPPPPSDNNITPKTQVDFYFNIKD